MPMADGSRRHPRFVMPVTRAADFDQSPGRCSRWSIGASFSCLAGAAVRGADDSRTTGSAVRTRSRSGSWTFAFGRTRASSTQGGAQAGLVVGPAATGPAFADRNSAPRIKPVNASPQAGFRVGMGIVAVSG